MIAYLALTFWLLMIVLMAWIVHQLWSGMIKAKILNTILLPGTLVAQLGHVLGLLVTGATISNTTLYRSDESGAPETTPNPDPRIPIIGPVIIGMLPLLACGITIYYVSGLWGGSILGGKSLAGVGPTFPASFAGVWALLHEQLRLVESIMGAALAESANWKAWLFPYLLICLTVRIAPFPGNLRGALGAIIILGIAGTLAHSLFDVADPRVQSAWSVLNLTLATLLLLLIVSLLMKGFLNVIVALRGNA